MDSIAHQSNQITQVADDIAKDLDADVVFFNGPIERPADRIFIDASIKRQRQTNVFLILVTSGGDADAAYRIARCLQEKYEKFTLYVSGYCKSAGTLVTTGAKELVFSDHGELGPLDVQMSKKDELWEWQSGLTVMDTLTALQDNAFEAFEDFFLKIKGGSGGSITLKTATEIATNMTSGLFAPLYSQIDPLHIGEAAREMSIARHYGQRLLRVSRNINSEALDHILSDYPSHGFVIDRYEAKSLFKNVREPKPNEVRLVELLGEKARWPNSRQFKSQENPFQFLSTEKNDTVGESNNAQYSKITSSRNREATEESGENPAASNGNRKINTEYSDTKKSKNITSSAQ